MALILDAENITLVTNEDRLGKLIITRVNALVARGWTVQGSGDGIATFQNAGQTGGPYNVFTSGLGYITTGGTWALTLGGANSISNARAWIRLREPSPSAREVIIQRTNSVSSGTENYMIEGMAYAGYLANNATANTPPTSAGISQVRYGSAFNGVGAEYLSSTALIASSHTIVYNLLVSDTVKAANSWPYIELVYNSTLASRLCGSIYESLVDYTPGDAHPVVGVTGTFVNAFGTPSTPPGQALQGVRDDGVPATSLGLMYYVAAAYGTYPNTTVPFTNSDSKVRSMPYYVVNNVALDGRWKGRMEHITMNVQSRNYPSTLFITTATPRLYVGNMMIPWKQNITPGT